MGTPTINYDSDRLNSPSKYWLNSDSVRTLKKHSDKFETSSIEGFVLEYMKTESLLHWRAPDNLLVMVSYMYVLTLKVG